MNKNISVADFRASYWLKEELVCFCKSVGLPTSGSKSELSERITGFLQTGCLAAAAPKQKPASTFDWNKAVIRLDTVTTDNYRNTENVRAFMTANIGAHFRFNTAFMNYMKQNAGKTMRDAMLEWKRMDKQK